MPSEVVTSPEPRTPHDKRCISSKTHRIFCMNNENGPRIVRHVDDHDERYIFHAEHGDWAWVADVDRPLNPFTIARESVEDIPKYEPHEVPQVGEMWSYQPFNNSWRGFLCVAVDEENGVWHFIDRGQMTLPLPEGRNEVTKQITYFTRPLPETYMKKRDV